MKLIEGNFVLQREFSSAIMSIVYYVVLKPAIKMFTYPFNVVDFRCDLHRVSVLFCFVFLLFFFKFLLFSIEHGQTFFLYMKDSLESC